MFNNVCVFKNAQFIMLIMLKSYLCFRWNIGFPGKVQHVDYQKARGGKST